MKKIGVVGAGLVGSCFQSNVDSDIFEVVHRDEWRDKVKDWDGIVNCCAIAGQKQCDAAGFDAVKAANVDLALDMATQALLRGLWYVTYSTGGVYIRSVTRDAVNEDGLIFPHNLYVASKILMEASMPPSIYIIRLPTVVQAQHLSDKVKQWDRAEDMFKSIIYPRDIVRTVMNVASRRIPPGIYNIHSEVVHFPSYIREHYGWHGEVVLAHSMGLTPACIMDISKAKRVGLL